MRILVDCDGVLANFSQGYLDIVEQLYGLKFSEDDIKDWNFHSLGLAKDQEHEVWNHIRAPGFALFLKPYPGAIEAIQRLSERHEVYVVSSPFWSQTFCHDRKNWLLEYGAIKTSKQLVLTESKHLVEGDVLIDDRDMNIGSWLQSHPNGHGFLWAQPYNVTPELGMRRSAQWTRTSDWNHVFAFAGFGGGSQ